MVNFTDTYSISPTSIPGQFVPDSMCISNLTQQQMYYIIVVSTDSGNNVYTIDIFVTMVIAMLQAITTIVVCPWTYFKFTSTKYIQLTTTVLRNIGNLLHNCYNF